MTCRPSICFTTMSCRKISTRLLGAACAICGNNWSRSYSATSLAFLGSVMSTMSTSLPSSLSTMTAYALSPASQANTLWISLAFFLPWPLTVKSPSPSTSGVGRAGLVTL